MTDIRIEDLEPGVIEDLEPGVAELFLDNESYIGELAEDELDLVAGGATPAALAASSVGCAGAVGASVGVVASAVGSLFD
jgi:hypothetical protein